MDNKLLIALVSSLIDDAFEESSDRFTGPRGPRGIKGKDGLDFSFDDNKENIKELINSYIDHISNNLKLKFEDLTEDEISKIAGPKGDRGKPGKDFSFEENKEQIKSIIQDCSETLKLKFSDLSDDEILKITGPKGDKGPRGQRGKSGQDFSFEENRENISNIILEKKDELKLKFSDLNDDEKNSLKGEMGDKGDRGIRGPKGLDGKDFSFEDCKESILEILSSLISEKSNDFKVKFSDLTEDEKLEIKGERGPRGQRGKSGKDFSFQENKEEISTEIQSFIDSIKDGLKLRFQDLTEDEKDTLKLRFESLTEDQKISLKGDRGARGPRGQRGHSGEKGEKGDIGPRGLRGPRGEIGLRGLPGINGQDGKDAAHVVEVEVYQESEDYISFIFHYSDGTSLKTNKVELPSVEKIYNNYFSPAVGGGGGGTGTEITISDDGVELGVAESIDFSDNLNVSYDEETKSATIESVTKIYDEGILVSDKIKSINFIGDDVTVDATTKMSDWESLEDVDSIGDYEAPNKSTVDVRIQAPSKFSLTRIAHENISRFDLVTLFSQTEVKKANADSYADAVVAGVAINNANAGQDVEFIVFGIIEDPSFNFPIKEPLFLSETSTITNTAITDVGKYLSKIGRSYGSGAVFVDINDPRGII